MFYFNIKKTIVSINMTSLLQMTTLLQSLFKHPYLFSDRELSERPIFLYLLK